MNVSTVYALTSFWLSTMLNVKVERVLKTDFLIVHFRFRKRILRTVQHASSIQFDERSRIFLGNHRWIQGNFTGERYFCRSKNEINIHQYFTISSSFRSFRTFVQRRLSPNRSVRFSFSDQGIKSIGYSRIILNILTKIRVHFGCMYKLVETISIVDVIQAFSEVSKNRDYVRPTFGDDTKLIKARHPVIEIFGQQKPISNDVELSPETNVLLISGPNMSGKSTYLRKIALLQVLAQIGLSENVDQRFFERLFFFRLFRSSRRSSVSNCSIQTISQRRKSIDRYFLLAFIGSWNFL